MPRDLSNWEVAAELYLIISKLKAIIYLQMAAFLQGD